MIIGIGTDIVEVVRVEKSIAKFGDKFLNRTFSELEQKHAASLADATAYYAKRFAAKEAFAKALGSGIGGKVLFSDVSTLNDEHGAPYITLTGFAAESIDQLLATHGGKAIKIHISLSDEKQYAQAFVILELI